MISVLFVANNKSHRPLISDKASSLVDSRFIPPRMAEVTTEDPGFFTPRMVRHRCSASTTTSTPSGFSLFIKRSAMSAASRYCSCSLLAMTSTTFTKLENPVILLWRGI